MAALGTPPPDVVEIVVEVEPPHDVVVYRVPDDTLDEGRAAYGETLVRLLDCEARAYWPGRARDVVDLYLPRWARALDEADEDGGLDGLYLGGEP